MGLRQRKLSRRNLAVTVAVGALALVGMPGNVHSQEQTTPAAQKPNIVLIYVDDLGYGDVGCYGATAVKTPNIDRLAREGLRFTNGYAPAATCTPSRYALMTGQYAFRKPGTGILPGDAALIIAPDQKTLPALLREGGYNTAVVGKWHLGLGTPGNLDWNKPIAPGPKEVGFDYSFIIPATGDRVPCVFVENQQVVGLDSADPITVQYGAPLPGGGEPTGKDHPELLTLHPSHRHDNTIINGISRIGYMKGGKAARWKDDNIADTLTHKATDFLSRQQPGKPFFLYFATHDIHVPRVPHKRFVGKTTMGPRGDAIAELDWSVGEILKTLESKKLAGQTLILFTSDNGPVLDDGYRDEAVAKAGAHRPAGPLRGGKGNRYEGGTRVPFIARWSGTIKPGTSTALISQIDFSATLAALTGKTLGANDAPDSYNVLPALLGKNESGRVYVVEQAGRLALRQGDWKLLPGENAGSPALFNLADDPAETKNVAPQNPARVEALSALLQQIRQASRTRP